MSNGELGGNLATTPEDGFRVVVGPYSTREEADAAGRRLGRPYFILTPGAGGTWPSRPPRDAGGGAGFTSGRDASE